MIFRIGLTHDLLRVRSAPPRRSPSDSYRPSPGDPIVLLLVTPITSLLLLLSSNCPLWPRSSAARG
jgi:hypothetical protein